MKAKQNTYRKFKKHPVRMTVKLITALVALNAAGIILSEQIHENGQNGFEFLKTDKGCKTDIT